MIRALLTLLLLVFSMNAADAATPTRIETAMFGGGCFWCMQPSFDNTEGVISTRVGYTGGSAETAHYDAVSTGKTGHVEVIEIRFNPAKVNYEKLVEIYFENIDPTDGGGQFADRGSQYMPVIYYVNAAQQQTAESVKKGVAEKLKKSIAVTLKPATPFYVAEDYHQRYYEKNALRYNAYKQGSGRADGLKDIWGQ
jgi:methionine-S-sulfoxide reductase